MNNLMGSLLLPGERIKSGITGIFEIDEGAGIHFINGSLMATDTRLIWFSKYPLGQKEIKIYKYVDLNHVDITQTSLSFHNGVTIKGKWISNGNMKEFLDTIKFFSLYRLIDKARKRFD
ncbi:PH domain-containing protein [Neobacillus sp. NPDC093127]|uniref:PH domain-containing protein n=1 Tax=Neobacillus sp. NPDC093127 TaxID=3364296 RepID=UPI0037FFCDA2